MNALHKEFQQIRKAVQWGFNHPEKSDLRLKFIAGWARDETPYELQAFLFAIADSYTELYTHEILSIDRPITEAFHKFSINSCLISGKTFENDNYGGFLLVEYQLFAGFDNEMSQGFPVKQLLFPSENDVSKTVYIVKDCPINIEGIEPIDILFTYSGAEDLEHNLSFDYLFPWVGKFKFGSTQGLFRKRENEWPDICFSRISALINIK